MQTAINGDWSDYYKVRYNHPARKTLLKGLDLFDNHTVSSLPKNAIDIGCGQGSDINELLKRGWNVVGYDKEQEAIDILNDRFAKHINKQLSVVLSDMENLPITNTTLVNASYSLPFSNPLNFKSLWDNIDKSIPVNGMFCGQLFGINDSWSINNDMTFHTSDEIKNIFNNLINFIKEVKFDRLGVFTYSDEEGTHAADNLEDNIPDKVKQERYDKIMMVQQEISLEKNKALVGQKDTVIIDKSSEEEQWSIARSYRDAPEIDNYVKIDEYIPEGQFIDVEYIQAFEYDLLAKRI